MLHQSSDTMSDYQLGSQELFKYTICSKYLYQRSKFSYDRRWCLFCVQKTMFIQVNQNAFFFWGGG